MVKSCYPEQVVLLITCIIINFKAKNHTTIYHQMPYIIHILVDFMMIILFIYFH